MNNEQLNAQIDELWAQTKAGNLPREQRFEAIERLTEEYIAAKGKRPPAHILDRLATLCVYEEITDDTAWKTRQDEYPFLSDEQLARRKDGIHQRKKEGGQREVSLKKASSVGTDRRDKRKPTRRERSNNENLQMDAIKSRNKVRMDRYHEFTKVQPVNSYYVGDIVGD